MDYRGKTKLRLDVGCGANKQPNFVGMDLRNLEGVDIVHDLEVFPFPLDDNSCEMVVGSHIVEHINPSRGIFIKFIEEIWRILEPGGTVAFAYPYGVGQGFQQDPTHCNPCNNATWEYFDPGYFLWTIYKTKPFLISNNIWSLTGQGEISMIKLTEEQGEARYQERLRLEAESIEAHKEMGKKLVEADRKKREKLRKENEEIKELMASEDRKHRIAGIMRSKEKVMHRLLYGVPATGIVRIEWVNGRMNQVIPTNWSKVDLLQTLDQWSPLEYSVADARNIIATAAVELDFEWLFFHDHDVVLPVNTYMLLADSMKDRKIPVWSGIYYTKSAPAEPLLYRGRGNGPYYDWKFGDKVWVDAIPMGCTMIHVSILKEMYAESEDYYLGAQKVKRIFETPRKVYFDVTRESFHSQSGTEDIQWCNRVIKDEFFDKAGWPEYQEKEWPFMVDTNLYCKHISTDGIQFPIKGEDYPHEPWRIDLETIARNDSVNAML